MSVTFFGPVWLRVAWCEATGDFRCFWLDRIGAMAPTGAVFQHEEGKRLADCKRNKGEQTARVAAV